MRISRRTILGFAGMSTALAAVDATALRRQAMAMQTPEPFVGSSVNATMLDLATFIPFDLLADNAADGRELMIYGDYALRLASVDVDPWSESDPVTAMSRFQDASRPVAPSTLATGIMRAEDPVSLFGWSIDQLDQEASVQAEAGVTTLTVCRGRFDKSALQAAWESTGYQPREVAGVSAYSLHEDASLDLTGSDISRYVLSHANNVALVDPNTLIYASTLPALTAMLEARAGDITSLEADPIVRHVIQAIPEPLTSGVLLPAAAFVGPPPIPGEQQGFPWTEEEVEPGPVPVMGVLGLVSGSAIPDPQDQTAPSGSKFVASRYFQTEEEAEIASARSLKTLEEGMSARTGQPWSEFFADWRVSIDEGRHTVYLEADLYGNETIWAQLYGSQDAIFLYG